MLPDRSKRIAGLNEDIPRLTLASNGHLVLVALMVAVLLVVIFPREALVEKLYDQDTLDELTLSYIQNLYRADTRNADLALLLARSQRADLSREELEELLTPLAALGDERQKLQARTLLIDRFEEQLETERDASNRAQILASAKALLTIASQDTLTKVFANRLADFAFDWDLPQLGLILLAKGEGGRAVKVLERYAEVALTNRNYAMSGEYYFLAREETKDLDEVRRLFQMGIKTLIEGGLYQPAMVAVGEHIGDLQDDPQTLHFVVRAARSSNDAAVAAEYGRRLVFVRAGQASTP